MHGIGGGGSVKFAIALHMQFEESTGLLCSTIKLLLAHDWEFWGYVCILMELYECSLSLRNFEVLSSQLSACTHSHAQSTTTITIPFLTIQCIYRPTLCVSYCTQAGLLAALEM